MTTKERKELDKTLQKGLYTLVALSIFTFIVLISFIISIVK